MNSLRILGILSMVLFLLGFLLGRTDSPLVAGQDAAGRGMFAGCIAVAFWGAALILAIIALIKSLNAESLDFLTLVLSRGPIVVLVIAIFLAFFIEPYS